MSLARSPSPLSAAFLLLISSTPLLADPDLAGRVGRIERILENQTGSELLLQMQRLQTEMQELRGMVEQQRFDIDKLQRQQRDQFIDLDSRLNGARGPVAPSAMPESGMDGARPALPAGVVDAAGVETPSDVTTPVVPAAPPTPSTPGAIGIPSLPTPETQGGSERDLYSQAFELLKERKYEESKAALNELLRLYPQGEYADNARYWLAEAYYVLRDYPSALAEYDRLVQLTPNSPKVPGAMLKIGFIQHEQRDFEQAKATLELVISRYPNSTEARLARSRLERMGSGSAH